MALYRRIRRYGTPAIALHWVVALGIFVLFVHGAAMMRIAEAHRVAALNLHRSIGVVVFVLVLVRIWWRANHPPPSFRMPELQEWLAHYVHILIYTLLVGNGFAGVVGWFASGDPIVFLGLELRGERDRRPELTRWCVTIGFATSRALLAAIVLHALAALKHHLLDHDRLIARMWPGHTILVTIQRTILEPMRRRRRSRTRLSGGRVRCRSGGAAPPRASWAQSVKLISRTSAPGSVKLVSTRDPYVLASSRSSVSRVSASSWVPSMR
jgi:cytochrome b561